MLTVLAKFEGPCQPIFHRLAALDGTIFLDLANAQGQVVEINQVGWRVVDRSRARFRRTPGMAALPVRGPPSEANCFSSVERWPDRAVSTCSRKSISTSKSMPARFCFFCFREVWCREPNR
jgi:hypothetical protein